MRRSVLVALSLIVVFSIFSEAACAESVTITGTVHYASLEGGCWYIASDTGQNYQVLNGFPDGLRVEGLRVQIVGTIRTDVFTACMIGSVVEVTSYFIIGEPPLTATTSLPTAILSTSAIIQTVTYTSTSAHTSPAYTTTQPYGFPPTPRSLAEVPMFLQQVWAWIQCQFFGRCL